MKAFLRSGPVQGALAGLLWFYLALVRHTVRWKRIDEHLMADHIGADQAAIGCFWHEYVPHSLVGMKTVRGRKTKVMISLSPDGEFVARAMATHGLPSIRGSSGKKSDPAKSKGGLAAFREAMQFLRDRGVLAIAPDGPRGPPRAFALGVVQMAKRSQTAVFFMGLAATPQKRLRTWDRLRLPAPFGRGAVVWDGPYTCPADADEAAMLALAEVWGARLSDACARAEAEIR